MTGASHLRPTVDSCLRTLPATRHLRLGVASTSRGSAADAELVAALSARCEAFAKSRWWCELSAWLAEGKGEDALGDRCHDPSRWALCVGRQAADLASAVGELANFGAAIGTLAAEANEGDPASGLGERVHALLGAGSRAVSAAARELAEVVGRWVTPGDPDADEAVAGVMPLRARLRLEQVTTLQEVLRLATACHHVAPDLADGASAETWASSVGEALAAAARAARTLAAVPGALDAGTALASAAASIRALVPLYDAAKSRRPRSARRATATTRRGTPR